MTGESLTATGIATGREDQGMAWSRRVVGALLDCALLPVLDGTEAEALMASVFVVLGDSAPSALSSGGSLPLPEDRFAFSMRAALVATAKALLDRPDPAADGRLWRRAALALTLADGWLDLPAVGRSEANSVRIRYALGLHVSEPPDRLAADMRQYRDEPLKLLADAPLLLRLVAAAWRLAGDGESSLSAVASLLDLHEPTLTAQLREAAVWKPVPASVLSEADLRRGIDRFQSLETALLPMADVASPAAALAALERLLPPWLGRSVLPLWVDGDGGLILHGTSDLAGHRLRGRGGRTVAAIALARGELTVQAPSDPAAMISDSEISDSEMPNARADVGVFDRQCAERLCATLLAAVPICAPEPVAILLTDADADAKDLNLVAIQAGRWLTRLAASERQLQRAQAEQLSRFTQRMREAVHEISNPLSVIQNYLHLLGTRIAADDPAEEQVRLISEELRRASSLLRTLTDAEPKEPASAAAQPRVDVNAMLSEVLALARLSLDPGAPIDVRFTPAIDLPGLAVADRRLQQVLLNLIKNALEAMPRGGVLDVAVDQAVNARGRRGIEIRITDTGAGIDPALLGQIFESGVSVKGEGRGLGLAITSRLVEELGGEISCRSRVGAGTTFVVWLPGG